jgi:hypothetical protein
MCGPTPFTNWTGVSSGSVTAGGAATGGGEVDDAGFSRARSDTAGSLSLAPGQTQPSAPWDRVLSPPYGTFVTTSQL